MNIELAEYTFKEMELRGSNSSGYYFERPSKKGYVQRCIKSCIKSTQLLEEIKNKPKARFNGTERLIMLHTRFKTIGSEFTRENNEYVNNHPLFNNDFIIVHNGSINNERLSDYPYKGTVDSENILAYIDKYGLVKGIEKLEGSIALLIKKFSSNILYMIRNNNPFYILYDKKEKILMGCTDKDYFSDFYELNENIDINMAVFLENTKPIKIPANHLFAISLLSPEITLIKKIKIPYSHKK